MELSIDNHIVGLIIKHHNVNETQNKYAQRACRMYHAACRTEFQPIDRSYSQLTFFQFFIIFFFKFYTACDIPNIEVDTKERVARHNQPNNIYTRQIDNKILIQYRRHREKPGINMTQATTTIVLKIQLLYRISHHQQT